jgi:predicted nucleic acid-binding protein
MALLLAVVVLAISNARVTTERNQKAAALRDRELALGEKAAALLAANEQAFRALWNEARARRLSRQAGQRLASLAALTQAARMRPDEGLRDEAIAIMAQPDVTVGPAWQTVAALQTSPLVSAAFDEGYRRCAVAHAQGQLGFYTLPDHREIRRIESGRVSLGLWLSNDGEFLAQLDINRTLRVWRVADRQLALADELPECSTIAFSTDSRQLIIARNLLIHRFDLGSGTEINQWRARAVPCSLALDPDNRRLAVGYADSTVASIYDPTDGTLVTDLPVGPIGQQVVAWHPHGDRLAVAGSDPRIQIWDVAAKRKLATLEGHVQ